ncbi:MAG: ABC transporter ATP-binding protein [Gaiella sp.]|uniref:ABC transporter ATP-binding protein n=1 Tax=Gaiella sp. TaxID=2663207 RepID=UPI002C4FA589|nr:ABC transporter ATP-binding protein [Gaiella sp.]
MSDAHAVEVDRLHVVRGGRNALDGITLDVARGTVTGLLGPSGSGKSTLMRAIVGTQLVTSGSVTVLGEPAGSPGLRRRVAYTTQSPAVYDDLTVRENVRYFARLVGAADTQADEVVELVGLGDDAGSVVSRLSGGQRSRVSLATALVGRPELLVLDEPTVGLDPLLRRDLWASFARLAADGATLLVSSHVMDEAERCDELLLVRGGRLLDRGTAAEIRARAGGESMDEAFLRLVETGAIA